jgi:hypothetical protein
VPKDGVRAGNSALTRQSKIQASAHAVAVDGRNRESGEARHTLHEELPHLCKAKGLRSGQRGNLIEVSPGGKEMIVACDDENRWRMHREFFEGNGQGLHARSGQSICALNGYYPQDDSVTAAIDFAQVFYREGHFDQLA